MPTLTLPTFISDLMGPCDERAGGAITVPAGSVADLYAFFTARHPRAGARLFDECGSVRKNVILVVNDELIPRARYQQLEFDDGDALDLLIQFAGG